MHHRAAARGLVDRVCDTAHEAVAAADLVILCVPVGAMEDAALAVAPALPPGVIVTDVGSSKRSVARALWQCVPYSVRLVMRFMKMNFSMHHITFLLTELCTKLLREIKFLLLMNSCKSLHRNVKRSASAAFVCLKMREIIFLQ